MHPMHNRIEGKYKRSLPTTYGLVITSLLLSGALPLSFILVFVFYLNTWYWIYVPLHSLVESLGSFAAITLALFILIMRRNRQLRPRYLWIASTLMGMGVLDLFHASMPPGKIFIWLHCLATLLGGLTLALVLLPERFADFPGLQFLPCATGVCSAFLGTLSFFFPEYLPVMGGKEKFSVLADSMNTAGGLGFLLAWFYFCKQEQREEYQNENNSLANFSLLFAVAALLFDFSTLWGPAWWFMHIVRLFAYFALLRFFLKIYSQDIGYVRKSRFELKKRTLELERAQRHLSDIIEYSPTAITLKDITGKFIVVNRKFSDLLACPQEDPVGKTAADLFPPDAAQHQQAEDEKVIQQGEATKIEEKYCHITQKTKTFIVDRFPLKGYNNEIYGVGTVMTDISERKRVETERKNLLAENTERIKELNCLYGLSRLAEHSDAALTSILKKMTELIASSWRHADSAGARIIIDGYETASDTFEETQWIQEAPILINGETQGRIQVCYSRKFPDTDEGPFLKEERHLINEIAVRLGNIIQRKNADIELRKAFEFSNKIIEEFPVGLSVYNKDGECIAINSCMEKITSFSQKQQLCSNYSNIDYWQDTGLCSAAKQSIALHTNICHNFKTGNANEKQNFFKSIFVPFMLHDEQRLLLMIENVTKQKEAEEYLNSALLEKESLLKEIHHRVKNNMQIVASLMFLQAQNIKSQEALDVLQESQDRIKSMSLVHELLYQSGNLSKVPFKEYIETIVSSLRQSYDAHEVLFQIEAESIDLPVDTAVPCGLIVNELVTNSFKHAFKDKENLQSDILTLRFIRENGVCVLSVSDNGSGFPVDYDWDSSSTLGLNLIRTLSNQLDAELKFKNQGGLTCRLRFSA
ncbi:PAS domain S-box-containing protein [Candidatus Electrothrix laxa]